MPNPNTTVPMPLKLALPGRPAMPPPKPDPQPGEPGYLLSVREVAEACNCSARTIWRLVADGEFPQPLEIGPQVRRWRVDDVRQWIFERTPVGTPNPV
jgi:prophage regulatory protein